MSDKEIEVIQGLIDLIRGLQTSVGDLTECCKILKQRVEKLEAK